MELPSVETSAPSHGSRRRSSMLAAQVMEAIRETDDEVFEEAIHFDFLVLGGGVAAGYWAKEMAKSLLSSGRTAAIVSGDPPCLVPFERPKLSSACLDPKATEMRAFEGSNAGGFPFVCEGSESERQTPAWYESKGITILSACHATSVDLDHKLVKVKRVASGSNGRLAYGDTIKVGFTRILIATGARARRINDGVFDSDAKGLQGSCFCTRHPEMMGYSPLHTVPGACGFGSVHYLRDLGDAIKLVDAMTKVEADGQDMCKEPVMLIGGGLLCCEIAAAMASHSPALQLAMVLPGDDIMSSTGFCKGITSFYEKQLARAGVVFAKGYRVDRLWALDEEGNFPTLEKSSQGEAMKKTLARTFGRADPHFNECRGVVLTNTHTGEKVWVAARFVVVAIGSVPNCELFRHKLALASDGAIITDATLRTSHSSGDVFAAGDVASVPVRLGGLDEHEQTSTNMRSEHVHMARNSGVHAARVMIGAGDASEVYDPVPCMFSRFLDVSWMFYGFTRGEACVLGLENFPAMRMFGAFWLHNGKLVGAFLEADPALGVDHSAVLELIAREQPAVLSIKRLQKVDSCPLEKLLEDPYCLAPPELGVGDFHADTDEASIEETFRKYAESANKVKRADIGAVMRDLGADWDAEELADALHALDSAESGFVFLWDFVRWWSN